LSPETCRVKPLRRINAIVASCWIYFTIIHQWLLQHIQRQLQKGPEADIKNLHSADNVGFRTPNYDVCKALPQKPTITTVT